MAARRILYPVCCLLFFGLAVSAQKTAADKVPFVRVRWTAATLHITYQKTKIDCDFLESPPDQSKPEYERFWFREIDEVRTRRLLEKDGKVYLLLDIEGPSVGGGNANCGAGTEKALALFRFDSEGLLDEPRVINYESCFQTIGQGDSPEEHSATPISSKQLFVKVFSFMRQRRADELDPVTVEVSFDPVHPELGLLMKESGEGSKAPTNRPRGGDTAPHPRAGESQ